MVVMEMAAIIRSIMTGPSPIIPLRGMETALIHLITLLGEQIR